MNRQKGVIRDSNSLIQHFNPACRVARAFPSLPISRFLMILNDYDVPYFNQFNHSKQSIPTILPIQSIQNYLNYFHTIVPRILDNLKYFPFCFQDFMIELFVIVFICLFEIIFYLIGYASNIAVIIIIILLVILILLYVNGYFSKKNNNLKSLNKIQPIHNYIISNEEMNKDMDLDNPNKSIISSMKKISKKFTTKKVNNKVTTINTNNYDLFDLNDEIIKNQNNPYLEENHILNSARDRKNSTNNINLNYIRRKSETLKIPVYSPTIDRNNEPLVTSREDTKRDSGKNSALNTQRSPRLGSSRVNMIASPRIDQITNEIPRFIEKLPIDRLLSPRVNLNASLLENSVTSSRFFTPVTKYNNEPSPKNINNSQVIPQEYDDNAKQRRNDRNIEESLYEKSSHIDNNNSDIKDNNYQRRKHRKKKSQQNKDNDNDNNNNELIGPGSQSNKIRQELLDNSTHSIGTKMMVVNENDDLNTNALNAFEKLDSISVASNEQRKNSRSNDRDNMSGRERRRHHRSTNREESDDKKHSRRRNDNKRSSSRNRHTDEENDNDNEEDRNRRSRSRRHRTRLDSDGNKKTEEVRDRSLSRRRDSTSNDNISNLNLEESFASPNVNSITQQSRQLSNERLPTLAEEKSLSSFPIRGSQVSSNLDPPTQTLQFPDWH